MRTSVFSGILWHQGESDCRDAEMALAHREKFITMITALRRELNAEELPLLIGELSESLVQNPSCGERILQINRQYREIAQELPKCAVISEAGLHLMADNLHFDAASLRVFGKRYFEAYKELIEN